MRFHFLAGALLLSTPVFAQNLSKYDGQWTGLRLSEQPTCAQHIEFSAKIESGKINMVTPVQGSVPDTIVATGTINETGVVEFAGISRPRGHNYIFIGKDEQGILKGTFRVENTR